MNFFEFRQKITRLWRLPETLDEIKEMLMTSANSAQKSAEDLQAKIGQLGTAIGGVAAIVTEARNKIAVQAQALEDMRNGTVDVDTLAAITASVDSSLDKLAKIVAPVVEDSDVDTGGVEVPPETNPGTVPPETVPIPPDAPPVVTEPSEVEVDDNGSVISAPSDSVDPATSPDTAPDDGGVVVPDAPAPDAPVAESPEPTPAAEPVPDNPTPGDAGVSPSAPSEAAGTTDSSGASGAV